MYSFTTRVRYSETDRSGRLSAAGLVNYFQDCATLHSSDVGLTVEELRRRRTVWVLSAWQLVISRMPRLGETVRVSTNPHRVKGFLGMRNFLLETAGGERLAIANSVWNIVDPETGRPTRMADDMPEKYGVGEPLEMDYADRKIRLKGDPDQTLPPFTVLSHMLDTNGHMNNAQYVALAADCLPEGFAYRQIRVEYKLPAHAGDLLYPSMYGSDAQRTIVLASGDARPCAVVEFA